MKSLRRQKSWSQEQLAQLSGLNVRTIQRVEKGQSAGFETLNSLAAVFEITPDELKKVIEAERKQPEALSESPDDLAQQDEAIAKVKSIKYFYANALFLIAIFVLFMLPNYRGGENFGSLLFVLISFCTIIAGHAFVVFQPFGEQWEKDKLSQILRQNRDSQDSKSDR